jgi:hypothetical protein
MWPPELLGRRAAGLRPPVFLKYSDFLYQFCHKNDQFCSFAAQRVFSVTIF